MRKYRTTAASQDPEPPSSLLVDLYELTMASAYRRTGMADQRATFSLFVRALPSNRSYLVAAGLDDALRWLEGLSFDDDDLAAVAQIGFFDDAFLEWLGGLRFTGDVRAIPEGTIVFQGEPLLEVDAPIVEAQIAETFLLNQVTLQTTLATKAARIWSAAAGRDVVEFGLRRTHGVDAGMKAARAAALVGFSGTSNIAAAGRYGITPAGTMAHSFIQAFDDELSALRAFAHTLGPATVLLVDTYDTDTGIDHAITVARELRRDGIDLGGIRIDSGDLAALARRARERLDDAGFPQMRIVVSGGLDEHDISRMVGAGAPIDGFGVGTSYGVSADAPVLDAVYKLVAIGGRLVRKTSPGKQTWPGAKQVWRADDWSGDVLGLRDEPAPGDGYRPLLAPVLADGHRTPAGHVDLSGSRSHFQQQWSELPERFRRLDAPARWPVTISPALQDLTELLDRTGQGRTAT